jgi:membrane-associated phospholipid phosphatase
MSRLPHWPDLRRPRDHSAEVTVGMIRLARTYSNIASPPVMFSALGLAVAWKELPFWPGLAWAAVFGFWISAAPILFVVWQMRRGRITNLHMNTAEERRLPYLVSVICTLTALAFVAYFRGPMLLRCLGLVSALELSVLGLLNARWLISIHTAAATATLFVTALVFGIAIAMALAPFALLIFWARLYLKRHTWAESLGGAVVGASCVWVVYLTGCFA